jgi:hypothetical protein
MEQLGIFANQQLIPKSFLTSQRGTISSAGGIQGGLVGVAEILAQIDVEIAQLQRARTVLKSTSNGSNGNGTHSPHAAKKRNLTPEGRRRISEAVSRRWAKQRKAGSGK